MNIKEAEVRSGVPRQNIRFYEREGLLHPERNPENRYRSYTDGEVRTLRLIRALRMLDMPLEDIGRVLAGQLPLPDAAQAQERRLREKSRELEAAIRFCGELSGARDVETLDVEGLLARMEEPEYRDGLFARWMEDYRKVVRAGEAQQFSFVPDEPIATPDEFAAALRRYAEEEGAELELTRGGMYPAFLWNGVAYTAARSYWRMGANQVVCQAVHPQELEPKDVPPARLRVQKRLRGLWCPAVLVLLALPPLLHLPGWAVVACGAMGFAVLGLGLWAFGKK